MMRFRITYQKTEALRYTGNLDIQKIWERYLRRAGLPVAYSQGFHPQARIQQALPLPLGFLSRGEQVDIFLDVDQITSETIANQLKAALYPGISILSIEPVDLAQPALTIRVTAAEYHVEFFDPVDLAALDQHVTDLLGASQIMRSRRDREYDLRPLVEDLRLDQVTEKDMPALFMRLAARQSATGRPEEVVAALGYDPFGARYIRTGLIFLPD